MVLTDQIKNDINRSVLCWLATVSDKGIPNVSPKEVFTYYKDEAIIIANIASPQSVKNIKANPQVCLSMIDILVQKGCQLKGMAQVIDEAHNSYGNMSAPLLDITQGNFPFKSLTHIIIQSYKPIIAPRYLLYPNTTEDDQIESAKRTYGLI